MNPNSSAAANTWRQSCGMGCLSDGRPGHFVAGAQAAGAQGHPTKVAIDGEGSMLDVGHETGLCPPLGVTHVVPCMPYLATQLTLSHLFPLRSTLAGTGYGQPVKYSTFATLTDVFKFSKIQALRLSDGDDFGNVRSHHGRRPE